MSLRPEVVVIGGGTGTSTLLPGLRDVAESLTAIVSTSDDGGSSGILLGEFDFLLPPGDIGQCLVGLSDRPVVRELLATRFKSGTKFEDQSLVGIILAGLAEANDGYMERAIDVLSSALSINGDIVPVTTDKHTLVMVDGGDTIRGESNIGKHIATCADALIKLDPPALLNPRAAEAIDRADLVVFAPGDPDTSLEPCMAVGGMAEALQATKARVVAVTNLVSKPGYTRNWHVSDQVKAYERHIGEGVIDRVLYNTEAPSAELLARYAAKDEYPMRTDPEGFRDMLAVAIGAPLVAKEVYAQDPNDRLIRRTLIRHDAAAVCRRLMAIYYE